ncbi:hypothetical protein D3C76_1423780 [compost metagenome]
MFYRWYVVFIFELERERAGTVPVRINGLLSDKYHVKQLFISETHEVVPWVEQAGI